MSSSPKKSYTSPKSPSSPRSSKSHTRSRSPKRNELTLTSLGKKVTTARENEGDNKLYLDVTNMTSDGKNAKIVKATKDTIYALPEEWTNSLLFVLNSKKVDISNPNALNFYLIATNGSVRLATATFNEATVESPTSVL